MILTRNDVTIMRKWAKLSGTKADKTKILIIFLQKRCIWSDVWWERKVNWINIFPAVPWVIECVAAQILWPVKLVFPENMIAPDCWSLQLNSICYIVSNYVETWWCLIPHTMIQPTNYNLLHLWFYIFYKTRHNFQLSNVISDGGTIWQLLL